MGEGEPAKNRILPLEGFHDLYLYLGHDLFLSIPCPMGRPLPRRPPGVQTVSFWLL